MKRIVLTLCFLSQLGFAQTEVIDNKPAEDTDSVVITSELAELAGQDQNYYKAIDNSYSDNFQLNQKTFSAKVEITKDFENIGIDEAASMTEADLELLISEFKAKVKVTISRPATSTQLMSCNFVDVRPDASFNLILDSSSCNNKFVISIKSDSVLRANTAADIRLLESILSGETSTAQKLLVQVESKVNSAKYSFLVNK